MQKLYDDVESNRQAYKSERQVKDLERRIDVMEGRIAKNKDPDKLPDLEDQLDEWKSELEERQEPGFKDVIDEDINHRLNERFGTYYNKKIDEKIAEIKDMEKHLGIEGRKDPLDEAVDGIDDDVVYIGDDQKPHHITETLDEVEAERVVYEDTMLCVMRNNLG